MNIRLSRTSVALLAVIGVVTAGSFAALRMTRIDEATLKLIPARTEMTAEVIALRDYVRIDTTNPPGNETRGAQFLIEELRKFGVEGELIESAPGRGNVYARIRGREPGRGLLLMHHIDVAPADRQAWTRDPFGGDISVDILWGRGTLDMKSVGIAHLFAFGRIARSGRQPERDLIFLAVADEEEGGALGTKWLIENRPDIFEGVAYAFNEGGLTEMEGGDIRYFAIETGSKQMQIVKLSSDDEAELKKARIALAPFFEPKEPERLLEGARVYFRSIAPYRRVDAHLYADIDRTIAEGDFWRLPPAARALTQNNIGVFAPQRVNGQYEMKIVAATLPDEEPQRIFELIERAVAPFQVTLAPVRTMEKSNFSPWGTDFTALLSAHMEKAFPTASVGPFFLGNATNDSRYLRSIGIAAYGFWPFPVDFFLSQSIHGADEGVRLDGFVRGVRMIEGLVEEYVG